ncbi:Uncharacterized ubiquitin-like protein YukD [Evansella caseinilytica]|uniref:Uncharacterized ubiquitin-like protein YukD n=1 Tax=Evansella caseinilytica TaxID=1503961 RepID=A0A1H3TKR6_9BACI|nr:EsaB/YukD family protein [Evansella caseinilytica]SDZ50458.1 Uncharacterized ubiquitin-like protein YukD [Evansella caseinilytica]
MVKDTHINVTMDFTNWHGGGIYDLRIPVHVSVKQLLLSMMEILHVERAEGSLCALKVITKDILISDDDSLIDYPITDGDILKVL